MGVDRVETGVSGEDVLAVGGVDDVLQVGGAGIRRASRSVELQGVVAVYVDVGHHAVCQVVERRLGLPRIGEGVVAAEGGVLVVERSGDLRLFEIVLVRTADAVGQVGVVVFGGLLGVAFVRKDVLFGGARTYCVRRCCRCS